MRRGGEGGRGALGESWAGVGCGVGSGGGEVVFAAVSGGARGAASIFARVHLVPIEIK